MSVGTSRWIPRSFSALSPTALARRYTGVRSLDSSTPRKSAIGLPCCGANSAGRSVAQNSSKFESVPKGAYPHRRDRLRLALQCAVHTHAQGRHRVLARQSPMQRQRASRGLADRHASLTSRIWRSGRRVRDVHDRWPSTPLMQYDCLRRCPQKVPVERRGLAGSVDPKVNLVSSVLLLREEQAWCQFGNPVVCLTLARPCRFGHWVASAAANPDQSMTFRRPSASARCAAPPRFVPKVPSQPSDPPTRQSGIPAHRSRHRGPAR